MFYIVECYFYLVMHYYLYVGNILLLASSICLDPVRELPAVPRPPSQINVYGCREGGKEGGRLNPALQHSVHANYN